MLLAALLWLWPHAAAAQVYHCIGAHGEPVYAGQPCGPPAAPPNAAGGPGAGFSAHCAASPDALRQAIGQAFAAHDVNRLAGFVVWRGLDQAAARAELQRLAVWLRQPVTGVQVTYAGGAPPPGAAPAPAASVAIPVGLAVTTAGSTAPRDFGLARTGGCWWLTF